MAETRVADPDWIRTGSGQWIRIRIFFSAAIFFQFLAIKALDPDLIRIRIRIGVQPKMPDPDPHECGSATLAETHLQDELCEVILVQFLHDLRVAANIQLTHELWLKLTSKTSSVR